MGTNHGRGNAKSRKELIKIVKKAGWTPIQETGGHLQFKHPIQKGKVTIPQKITKNVEKSVLAQAGLRRNIYKEAGK